MNKKIENTLLRFTNHRSIKRILKLDLSFPFGGQIGKPVVLNDTQQWCVASESEAIESRAPWCDKADYIGDLVDGKPHGRGLLKLIPGMGMVSSLFPNIYLYNGEWQDGNLHGKGLLEEISHGLTVYTYNGDWVNGKKHGFGNEVALDWEYSGRFENDERCDKSGFKNGPEYGYRKKKKAYTLKNVYSKFRDPLL